MEEKAIFSKINTLLQSQQKVHNTLVYELLQSQLKYTPAQALQYIFEYQCQFFWQEEVAIWKFEVHDWLFSTHFYYDDEDGQAYGFDHLYLFVQIPNTVHHQSQYLGTLAAKAKSPILLQYESEAQVLFGQLVKKLFTI